MDAYLTVSSIPIIPILNSWRQNEKTNESVLNDFRFEECPGIPWISYPTICKEKKLSGLICHSPRENAMSEKYPRSFFYASTCVPTNDALKVFLGVMSLNNSDGRKQADARLFFQFRLSTQFFFGCQLLNLHFLCLLEKGLQILRRFRVLSNKLKQILYNIL